MYGSEKLSDAEDHTFAVTMCRYKSVSFHKAYFQLELTVCYMLIHAQV